MDNSMKIKLIHESLRLLEYLTSLEHEMGKEHINKNKCSVLWGRVKTSLDTIKRLILSNVSYITREVPATVFLNRIYDPSLDGRVEELITDPLPEHTFLEFNDPKKLISDIRVTLRNIWEFYGIYDEIFPIIRMMKFVSRNPLGLNQNWAIAVVYLTALEIAINKKRKELKLKDTKEILKNGEKKVIHKTFEERFKELIKVIQDRGLEFKGIKRELPQAFWKARNDVVHGGHAPDDEELELIMEWVERIINSLFPGASLIGDWTK